MKYYLEQRKKAAGLWQSVECTSGRIELRNMTGTERQAMLHLKRSSGPKGFTVHLIETPHDLKEIPFTI